MERGEGMVNVVVSREGLGFSLKEVRNHLEWFLFVYLSICVVVHMCH